MLSTKEPKTIKKSKNFPSKIFCLCALNDGGLAIGGFELIIYNMKTYRIDIYIDDCANFIKSLSGNKLFYNNGKNNLVELSEKDYINKSDILPEYSDYNILYEISNNTLLAGKYYQYQTEDDIKEKIVKLEKDGEKYKIKLDLGADGLINFILLENNIFAVLRNNVPNVLCFYNVNNFKCIKHQFFSPETNYISPLNEKYMLIGTNNDIIIYDYINFKANKKIKCNYNLYKIKTNNYKLFVCESIKDKNQMTEYEIDKDGNYKKIYINDKFKKKIVDLTLVSDGRLITCSEENVKIW